MTKRPYRRAIWIINGSVQFKLIGYVVGSIVTGIIYTAFVQRLIRDTVTTEGLIPGSTYALLAVSGLMLFSLVVALGMYLTNQIAGPLYRLQRELAKIADGAQPERIYPRRHDSYRDLIQEYNRAIAKLGLEQPRDDQ